MGNWLNLNLLILRSFVILALCCASSIALGSSRTTLSPIRPGNIIKIKKGSTSHTCGLPKGRNVYVPVIKTTLGFFSIQELLSRNRNRKFFVVGKTRLSPKILRTQLARSNITCAQIVNQTPVPTLNPRSPTVTATSTATPVNTASQTPTVASTPTTTPTVMATGTPTPTPTIFPLSAQVIGQSVFDFDVGSPITVIERSIRITCRGCLSDSPEFTTTPNNINQPTLTIVSVYSSVLDGQDPEREYTITVRLPAPSSSHNNQGSYAFSVSEGSQAAAVTGLLYYHGTTGIRSNLLTLEKKTSNDFASLFSQVNPAFTSNANRTVMMTVSNGLHYSMGSSLSIEQHRIGVSGQFELKPAVGASPKVFLGRPMTGGSWQSVGTDKWKYCSLPSIPTSGNQYQPITLYIDGKLIEEAKFPKTGSAAITATTGLKSFTFNNTGMPSIGSGERVVRVKLDQHGEERVFPARLSSNSLTVEINGVTNNLNQVIAEQIPADMRTLFIQGSKVGTVSISGADEFLTSYSGSDNPAFTFDTDNCVNLFYPGFDPNTAAVGYSTGDDAGFFEASDACNPTTETCVDRGGVYVSGIEFFGGPLKRTAFFDWGSKVQDPYIYSRAGSNMIITRNVFGQTAGGGIFAITRTHDIAITENRFTSNLLFSIRLFGSDLMKDAVMKNITISDNLFNVHNKSTDPSPLVDVAWAGQTNISNNSFPHGGGIHLGNDRYYYLAYKWCTRIRYKNAQADYGVSPDAFCRDTTRNMEQLSWNDAQDLNPARDIYVTENYIRTAPVTWGDGGAIYVWGFPYTGTQLRSITVDRNLIINPESYSSLLHRVGIYLDDAVNSFRVTRNSIISPQGHLYSIYAKGRGGIVEKNLVINPLSSKLAMVAFAEFDAMSLAYVPYKFLETSNPDFGSQVNREYNREISLRSNIFIQVNSGDTPSFGEKRGDFYWFLTSDYGISDPNRPTLIQSNNNIFVRNPNAAPLQSFAFSGTRPWLDFSGWKLSNYVKSNPDSNSGFVSQDITDVESIRNGSVYDAVGSSLQPYISEFIGRSVGTTKGCINLGSPCLSENDVSLN